MSARVVTQFCFDAGTTAAYVDALRSDGATAPVSLGVVGPCARSSRVRMAERCGVKPPADADHVEGGAAADDAWPWDYARTLARWQAARGASRGAQALHLYPFGGLGMTLEWLSAAAADDAAAGLGLEPLP